MNTLEFKKGQTYICTKSDKRWWTVGKEYPVFLDSYNEPAIKDDEYDDWHSGYLSASNNQFKLKEEQPKVTLDEPQKPVVPKFVAEWFEENKDNLDNTIFGYLVFWEERDTSSELYQWFAKSKNKPIETIVRMKDGYEVEKEPLYTVEMPSIASTKLVYDEDYCKYRIVEDYTVGYLRHHLTEKEIKAFDERYWAFAVPVEGDKGE